MQNHTDEQLLEYIDKCFQFLENELKKVDKESDKIFDGLVWAIEKEYYHRLLTPDNAFSVNYFITTFTKIVDFLQKEQINLVHNIKPKITQLRNRRIKREYFDKIREYRDTLNEYERLYIEELKELMRKIAKICENEKRAEQREILAEQRLAESKNRQPRKIRVQKKFCLVRKMLGKSDIPKLMIQYN